MSKDLNDKIKNSQEHLAWQNKKDFDVNYDKNINRCLIGGRESGKTMLSFELAKRMAEEQGKDSLLVVRRPSFDKAYIEEIKLKKR